MTTFLQTDFSGGMNLYGNDTSIGPTEYTLAYNIRNRTTSLLPVKSPVEDTTAPTGKKQGIYAFDVYILIFNNGESYYKDILKDSDWTKITGLTLDTKVDYIYAEAVPASVLNFHRALTQVGQAQGTQLDPKMIINNGIRVNDTPAGLVVQDGINQGYVVFPDGTTERLNTYEQWSLDDRSYVPIMKQMKYVNGILFGMAPDGVTLLRSVSGRPLDFVVNVDINGVKGGNASTTAYSVGAGTINCLRAINTGDLFLATGVTCYPVQLNYDKLIFGEPTFTNNTEFSAGVTNQFSFIDMLGDYGFIDSDGIRSFNAVNTQQNEGRNSVFSRNITTSLVDVFQNNLTAAIVFDNYSIFSINTVYGYVLAIYDNIRAQWVCFDKWDGVGAIKQFAVARQSLVPTLYAITDSKVYKLFSGTSYAPEVGLKAVTTGSPVELKLNNFKTVMTKGTIDGVAILTPYLGETATYALNERLYSDNDNPNTKFNFERVAGQSWKIKPKLDWNTDHGLTLAYGEFAEQTSGVSIRQVAELYRK